MSECPSCGEADPILYPGEDGEKDYIECPECGWGKYLKPKAVSS